MLNFFIYTAYGVLGVVRCRSWGVCVLVVCCTAFISFVIYSNSLYITQKRQMNLCTTAGTDFLKSYVACSAVVPEF